jgi:predicted amidohydrolase
VICHEGWRYPETVRSAVRRGAQLVIHPQFHEAGPGAYRPASYADPANSFHEKAVLCRAAENTCYFASVNYAGAGSPTTSAVAAPERVRCSATSPMAPRACCSPTSSWNRRRGCSLCATGPTLTRRLPVS